MKGQILVMTDPKGPLLKPVAFVAVMVGIVILVSVGSFFLIGIILQ